MTEQTIQTLRIPRGLWADLEETTIQQDRQFLISVARELHLPVADVLRRCLGMGTMHGVPTLWGAPTEELCPWWDCHGDGLWRRCPRLRLSPTLPCQMHERCVPCPMARLDSDPFIRALPVSVAVRWDDTLYWVDPDGNARTEDGALCEHLRFRRVRFQGRQEWAVEELAATEGHES
jgi:hypothetical protein